MTWGEVWVSSAPTCPPITDDQPGRAWVYVGEISRDEKSFVEETQRLQNLRGGRSRAVDFYVQIHSQDLALNSDSEGTGHERLAFDSDGLWVAVDLTAPGSADGPQFAVFTKRVQPATMTRRPPEPHPGLKAPITQLALRASTSTGTGVLEWAYRARRV